MVGVLVSCVCGLCATNLYCLVAAYVRLTCIVFIHRQANALVVTIQEKTAKAAALTPPTDNADFENLSLNLLPPGS